MSLAPALASQIDADFTADVTSGMNPLTVSFTDATSGATPFTWQWNFGGGSLDTDSAQLCDVNGDDDLDIVVAHRTSAPLGGIWWHENLPGPTGFSPLSQLVQVPFINGALLADLDGDGDGDALATRWALAVGSIDWASKLLGNRDWLFLGQGLRACRPACRSGCSTGSWTRPGPWASPPATAFWGPRCPDGAPGGRAEKHERPPGAEAYHGAMNDLPLVIQGGMGAGVSAWQLAQAVCRTGQLGVVAGTALDVILARRLQLGDPGGHMRRALAALPIPGVAAPILAKYFVPGGKAADAPFVTMPLLSERLSRHAEQLLVAANFVEVFLAREGHGQPVGINFLEKIQVPTLPSLFGAMLAGVSYVLMGAGIPVAIPGILDDLAQGLTVELGLDVQDVRSGEAFVARFDPAAVCGGQAPRLQRPRFLAIVSSASIASVLSRKASGHVDGFIVEGPSAGGHNAPPRGRGPLSATGEPVYGPRDAADLEAFRALGRPFWLAGSQAGPEHLAAARAAGATGIQVGTAFAFCDESGIEARWKALVLKQSREGQVHLFTDPVASPTGFPFKVLQLAGTQSDDALYQGRERTCDLGYLRHAYRREDGRLGWRCPGEPVATYKRKGGEVAHTAGRKCVCNGLLANVGLAQRRSDGTAEAPLLTAGDDVATVARFLPEGRSTYQARDVIDNLLRRD